MTEKWWNELEKLRTVELPAGLDRRIAEGPKGAALPGPSPRQRLVAGVVAIAVFAAAGLFAWNALRPTRRAVSSVQTTPPAVGSGVLTLSLMSGPQAPNASLSFGDQVQQGVRESYTWCDDAGQCVSGTADFATYPPVTEFLPVPVGAQLDITGDATSMSLTALTTVDGQTVQSEGLVPTEPGRYAAKIDATWPHGNATFFFGIEVVPEAASTDQDPVPDLLHVTCTPNSTTVDSSQVRPQSDGVHIAVDASGGVTSEELVTVQPSGEFLGLGGRAPSDGSRGVPIAPGEWSVGCTGGGSSSIGASDIGTSRVAAFSVVDPEHLFVPFDFGCSRSASSRVEATGGHHDQLLPQNFVPGILPTDLVKRAGYPDGPSSKAGIIYTVMRKGVPFARLVVPYYPGHSWSIAIDACAGSGINGA